MIIMCGDRRISRDRFGYFIERRTTLTKGKRAGEVVWREDRPAYPATLTDALTMVYERTLADQSAEIDVGDLPEACKRAARVACECMSAVRRAGNRAAAAELKRGDSGSHDVQEASNEIE